MISIMKIAVLYNNNQYVNLFINTTMYYGLKDILYTL